MSRNRVARALDAGAADYIVKPFSPAELAARVAPFGVGELSLDRTKC